MGYNFIINVKKKISIWKPLKGLKINQLYEKVLDDLANFLNDFLQEYSNKIYDTRLNYSSNMRSKQDPVENLKIYIIAFVRYVTESDNIVYFGIILIIISIILYFVSIINN